MPLTAQLGTAYSYLGNLTLGMETQADTQIVVDVLSLVDEVTAGTQVITDVLALVISGAGYVQHTAAASDTLSLVTTGDSGATSVEDTLTLADDADGGIFKIGIVSQTLSLTDELLTPLQSRLVSDPMALSQSASFTGPIHVSVVSNLNFVQTAAREASDRHFGVEHTLQLESIGRVPKVVSVSQTLVLVQTVPFVGRDDMVLVQMVAAGRTRPVLDELALADNATRGGSSFNRTASNALQLAQAASFFLARLASDCRYSPFLGTGDGSYPQLPDALPCPLPDQQRFRLVYPPTGSVTDSLILRAPNLGNRDRLTFNRINRTTRGGTLVIFADPTWPKTQSLLLSFSGLKQGEARALLTFMKAHVGVEIGMIDWEGHYWTGIIVTPDDPIIQDGRNSFSASFEFQGEPAVWTEQELPDPEECVPPPIIAKTPRHREPICCPTLDTSVISSTSFYEAETDEAVLVGSPVYMKGTGHLGLARAVSGGLATVAGLSTVDRSAGFSVSYLTEGKVSRPNWTAITGSSLLTPGATYFLDPTTAGKLTTIAPTTPGQFVAPVGKATNTTTLDIEIGQTVRM